MAGGEAIKVGFFFNRESDFTLKEQQSGIYPVNKNINQQVNEWTNKFHLSPRQKPNDASLVRKEMKC